MHSCEAHEKSKSLKANWNLLRVLQMYLNKQGSDGKMKCTLTTGKQIKNKVQHWCNELSLREESSVPLACGVLFSSTSALFLCLLVKGPHTIESLITEPSLTRGRGHVGEISTWLSLRFRGLFSDSDKLLLLSGDEHSCGGVLQM